MSLRALIVALTLASACTTPSSDPEISAKPGFKPEITSEEAGLWMVMSRVEKQLKTAGHRVTDPALTNYFADLTCRLAGEYCGDIRTYVVERAGFNASMAPNGVMVVWTGLLLRVDNEAQLAYVIGHELAHYIRRHSLQRWEDARAKTGGLIFLQMAAAAVGLGVVGDLAALVAMGSIQSFSRDAEREADRLGLEMVARLGYDPREATKIWRALIAERDAGDLDKPPPFFSTHPSSEERMETLAKLSEEHLGSMTAPVVVGREPFRDLVRPHELRLWRQELRRRELDSTQVILDRRKEEGDGLGQLKFVQGEIHRLRGKDEYEDAVEAYRGALDHDDAPAEVHRALGLVYRALEKPAEARASFIRYLGLRPNAEDREMIGAYIDRL